MLRAVRIPWKLLRALVGLALMLAPLRAQAIPAFARKYETSCTTCHTAWPVLNPFGEAFRRNGFRFPGDDSDETKQPTVKLGRDIYKKVFPKAVWPDSIANAIPISMGFIGGAQAALPGTAAAAGSPLPNPGSPQLDAAGNPIHPGFFSLMGLTAEAHLWAGGTFNNSLSFFGEVTLTDAGIDLERGYLIFDDILSGAVGTHVFNLLVGKTFPTLTSFDNHSSYVLDGYLPEISLPSMLNGNGTFTPGINELNTIELNGVVLGRLDYSLGFNSGTNDYSSTVPGAPAGVPSLTPPSADAYAHVGAKIGGMRLDGEGGGQTSSNAWAETAVTMDLFGYHSEAYFNNEVGGLSFDTTLAVGGVVRAQLESFVLSAGVIYQDHNHPDSSGAPVSAITPFGEASYVVFPWLIPALRVEYTQLNAANDPAFTGSTSPGLTRVLPAVNFVVRPNIVVKVVADIERSEGAPPGGWGGAGSVLGGGPLLEYTSAKFLLETVGANLNYAF